MLKKNWGRVLSTVQSIIRRNRPTYTHWGNFSNQNEKYTGKEVCYDQIALNIQLPWWNYRIINGRKRVWMLCLNKLETAHFSTPCPITKDSELLTSTTHTRKHSAVLVIRRMSRWQWHFKKMTTVSQFIRSIGINLNRQTLPPHKKQKYPTRSHALVI